MLLGRSLYVGYLMEAGATEASASDAGFSTPRLNGITYWERQGFVSNLLTGIFAAAATSVRAFFAKDVSYEKHGDVWWKRTTYYTEEERREITEQGGELGAAIATAGGSSAFELTVYSRTLPGGGDGTGYKLNFLFGSGIGENFLLEYGLGFGSIRAYGDELDTNTRVELASSYFGVPLRFSWAAPWFVLYAQWDMNVAALFDRTEEATENASHPVVDASRAPLRVGGQTNLFGRVFVDAAAVTPSPLSGDLAFRLVTGVRF